MDSHPSGRANRFPDMQNKEIVVSLYKFKRRKAAQRGFREWRRLFETFHGFGENTRWSDLPDWLLLYLCEGSPESRLTLYDLLMGVSGLGSGYDFEALPPDTLMPLLDAYFVLMDQVHYECMRRLGWIENSPWAEKPVVDQVREAAGISPFMLGVPEMTPQHPAFGITKGRHDFDYGRWLRKHVPKSIHLFAKRITAARDKEPGDEARSPSAEG